MLKSNVDGKIEEREYKSKLVLEEEGKRRMEFTIYDLIENYVNKRPRAALYREREMVDMD